jgi:C4-dicarboxylate-specific signal transduction histidine kinase
MPCEHSPRLLSMDAVAAALAHELKQPLTAIATNVDAGRRLLQRDPANAPDVCEILDDIGHLTVRVTDIVESLRSLFSSSGQMGPCNLNDLVAEVVTIVRPQLDARGIVVRIDAAPSLPPILGHYGQLRQMMLNLVRNAVDAMENVSDRPRLLTIASGPDAYDVTLLIADSGSSVRASDLDRVFEPFFTTKANGMGLGLAISKAIVDAHGGTISVSPRSTGAIVRVQLPYRFPRR